MGNPWRYYKPEPLKSSAILFSRAFSFAEQESATSVQNPLDSAYTVASSDSRHIIFLEDFRLKSSDVETKVQRSSPDFQKNSRRMADLLAEIKNQETVLQQGGGAKAIESQHKKNRLTARERIAQLIDPQTSFFELGIYAAYEMYEEWGGAPAAGTVTGLARVCGRLVMIIANDATVKAGAFFPLTAKKVIRAQNIAIDNHIPTIYLVDSAGVFLPLQEDVFPDTDDFGRVFRNNAVMSAMGIPQITAIMGMCVAGGAYLPVMCDHILMTEGSGLFLAGPALVQAAIGQKVSAEELGGAKMHAEISGTVDFREPDDEACLEAPSRAGGQDGPSGAGAFRFQAVGASCIPAGRALRNFLFRSGAAIRHARGDRAHRGRRPVRGVPRGIRQDCCCAATRASAAGPSASSPINKSTSPPSTRPPASAASNSAA